LGTWRLDNLNIQGTVTGAVSPGSGWYIDSVSVSESVCCASLVTPPVASFTANPTNGVEPLTVTFTDTSTGTITNRFWDFGDGSTTNVTTNVVVHTYAAGNFPVTQVVSGPGGAATNTDAVYILVLTAFQSWQVQYFGSTNNPAAAPDVDPDSDGQNNTAEFLSGTDPTSGISVFRILSPLNCGSGDVITWSAVPGKVYQPQLSGAVATAWQNVGSPVTAGVSETTLTITNAVEPTMTNRFYRIFLVPSP